MKENLSSPGSGFLLDHKDYTVMRSRDYFLQIFKQASLNLVMEELFEEFPEYCLPVMKFVLQSSNN